jgi:hypothetical protein
MKNGAIALVMVATVFGGCYPAFAQGSVGGPKKQSPLGGAVKQTSPVVPVNKGASVSIPPLSKPVSPPSAPPSASASHVKCGPGPCLVKGSK